MITKEYIFSGIVQGMGFRPTALRLATELGITGTVCNRSSPSISWLSDTGKKCRNRCSDIVS